MKQTDTKTEQRDAAIFKWVAAALLVAAAVATVFFTRPPPANRAPGEPDRPRQLGDFHLTDRTGRAASRAELNNKFLVVNFVFTSCAISCAQVNQRMAEVQRLATNRDDVRLVSFTVDPGTDTPPVLAEFGAKFGADTNRWLLLTGDKRTLHELIEDSFLRRDPGMTNSPMPGGFMGTERIVLVDRAGRIRRYFDGYDYKSPAAILNYLNQLTSEKLSP